MIGCLTTAERHPLERGLIAAREAGQQPSIENLGGMEAIISAAEELSASPMMPDLLQLLLQFYSQEQTANRTEVAKIVKKLLQGASIDFVLVEAVDILEQFRGLSDELDEPCFTVFLEKATDTAGKLNGFARAAALDGAFRWAASNRRWQFRLLDFLLGLSPGDDPTLLGYAAKITGVAYSHWRERDLLRKLTELVGVETAQADACFELGMANLADGFDAPSRETAQARLDEAKGWFDQSASAREGNPEARLYQDCLEILTQYSSGLNKDVLLKARERVQSHAFELAAWSRNGGPPWWLGSRQTEATCWILLANTITGLVEHLEETAWWEPAAVIEQYILATYTAGRSILRRQQDGTISHFLRPTLAASLAREKGQAFLLKAWLKKNTEHEWANEARQLIEEVDRLIEREIRPEHPSEAAPLGQKVAALIDRASLPVGAKSTLHTVVSSAIFLHVANTTQAEEQVIEACRKAVGSHPDHCNNSNGRALFDCVLLWTVRFVSTRLELTKKDDPTIGYLFEREDGKLPRESELQDDYFRWLTTNAPGTGLEVTNVGGGRADIRVQLGSERLIVEVKREMENTSFDVIAASYAAQATDYQNVSIRLGFILVLDLVGPKNEGTPHITTLFETRDIARTGETVSRSITMVKVPGRRKRPSDLTKAAKPASHRGGRAKRAM